MAGETLTGEYFAGAPVYSKLIDVGALPNNSDKNVSTGLTSVNYVWIDTANSMVFNSGAHYPFPYIDPGSLSNAITGRLQNSFTTLTITTKTNWTGYACIVAIKYTKL